MLDKMPVDFGLRHVDLLFHFFIGVVACAAKPSRKRAINCWLRATLHDACNGWSASHCPNHKELIGVSALHIRPQCRTASQSSNMFYRAVDEQDCAPHGKYSACDRTNCQLVVDDDAEGKEKEARLSAIMAGG
jgi:hypothetical protein